MIKRELTWKTPTPDEVMKRELIDASPDGQAASVVREATWTAMLANLDPKNVTVRLYTNEELKE